MCVARELANSLVESLRLVTLEPSARMGSIQHDSELSKLADRSRRAGSGPKGKSTIHPGSRNLAAAGSGSRDSLSGQREVDGDH